VLRILLVDDDQRIRTMIREYAQAEDWRFDEAGSGEEALRMLVANDYSLAVVDVMMPRTDGWAVLKKIREAGAMPVIMLTARAEEYDRLLGFELGADDYVCKPFSPRELVARIKALLKRSGILSKPDGIMHFGGLRIDEGAHAVAADGKTLPLTPKEYDLLSFFASHPNTAFTRDQILNRVWGYDYYGDARTVDTHIRSLRDKLEQYSVLIATVWGTGYRFEWNGAK